MGRKTTHINIRTFILNKSNQAAATMNPQDTELV